MNQFLRRLERVQQAIDAKDCKRCAQPIEAATDESFLRQWAAPCPLCGRQRSFLDLALESVAALAVEGMADDAQSHHFPQSYRGEGSEGTAQSPPK